MHPSNHRLNRTGNHDLRSKINKRSKTIYQQLPCIEEVIQDHKLPKTEKEKSLFYVHKHEGHSRGKELGAKIGVGGRRGGGLREEERMIIVVDDVVVIIVVDAEVDARTAF